MPWGIKRRYHSCSQDTYSVLADRLGNRDVFYPQRITYEEECNHHLMDAQCSVASDMAYVHLCSSQNSFCGLSRNFEAGKREKGSISQGNGLGGEKK